MTSVADVVQRVGEDLALVPIGQSLQSHHSARITKAYNEVYGRLKKKGLATWALADAVPDELTPAFSLMVCEKLLTSFSVPEARYQRIKQDAGQNGNAAEMQLAELAIPAYDPTDEEKDY